MAAGYRRASFQVFHGNFQFCRQLCHLRRIVPDIFPVQFFCRKEIDWWQVGNICQSGNAGVAITSKLFKPFLQNRERGDLILDFVIHCSINCYDNQTKNHCSERDPPRPRSEHKFYGTSLLIDSYATIYIHRRLSRDVPVFAQIGAVGNQTNQANSSKPNAIRQNQG